MPIKNIKGNRYNRLIVVEFAGTTGGGKKSLALWKCLCDCGKEIIVVGGSLRTGNTNSCGCYAIERQRLSNLIHGHVKHRLHNIWMMMKQRCYNENYTQYKDYGGRGLVICDKWKQSFVDFYDWAMNNGYDENLTIDRMDNSIGYYPENCRWATKKSQQNNMRSNVTFVIGNETLTLKQISEKYNIDYGCLRSRLMVQKLTVLDAINYKRKK